MPNFHDQYWLDGYRVSIRPAADWIRGFLKLRFIPYLYSAEIRFNMKIVPPSSLRHNEHLLYEWILWCGNGKDRYQKAKGSGSAKVSPGKTYNERLYIDFLVYPNQHVFDMRFGRTKEEMGGYKTQANFTVEDRDKLYGNLVLLALAAILGGIAGAIMTLIIQAIT